MNNYPDTASLKSPWWINSTQQEIMMYDYSAERLEKAQQYIEDNNLTIDSFLTKIKQNNHDDFSVLFAIGKLLQDGLIHNPVFQPSEKRPLSFKEIIISSIRIKPVRKRQLVNDVLLLLLLGEARCGQTANSLIKLLDIFGIKAKIELLHHHVVANVILNDTEYLIDVDGFKNGVFFFKDKKNLFTKKEILNNPQIVDRFKHTGWMFRKNTKYAINTDDKEFTGYVDFFMPENDGLISGKFGNKNTYFPPGVPIWNAEPETDNEYSFNVPFAERADYFIIRICKKTKGYSYDNLVYKNLLNESADIVKEIKTTDTHFIFSEKQTGEYYITVCAMSDYLEQNKCYVWWSDELKIVVKQD